ncbi:invasion gene expression up-regulator, SirB [Litchfieldella anticariensis FP35 = DSM 16096]|uniref:Invasion gene expression up-regulator, SirB n=1 Tax=Litchfieldella anticariensis (strain DSM 16096 / CECT 5854 / CIP 108499 / LMG 22089 / FP35) TaxID=1121939 RepID=S2KZM2_LITA3|nr:SirB2 family protein [Halomonas anticariensis]EPC00859.1 invasion gene expression up-regulator, SirB [Halomonas anticariensis FP35 = DSM 16096]
MEHYSLIKHLHMTAAGASLALFVLRAWWSVRESPRLQRMWVRVVPHLIDTALLLLGVWLMVMLRFWPHQHPWLAAKLIGLVVYIVVGTVAIKRGRTPRQRGLAAIAAVLVFVYIIGAAVQHHPLSWLSLGLV